MDIQELQDYLVPNGTNSQVTLYKSSTSDTLCFKNKRGIVIPVGSGGGVVNKNMSATGTTASNTKTILTYGVNVFTNVSNTAYAAKLPTPVTGQSVVVVNNSGSPLNLYPSMPGGKINGIIDGVAIVPNDGKAYTFYCIENPLPGEWTWDAPATGQYLSDIITIPSIVSGGTSNTNPIYSIYNSTNYVNVGTGFVADSVSQSGILQPLILTKSSGIYFKFSPYKNNVTKLKIWTNLLQQSTFTIMGSLGASYYDISTGAFVNTKYISAGNLTGYQLTNKVIPGTPSGGYVSTNIGDAGTRYGEMLLPSGLGTGGNSVLPIIGDKYLGQEIEPNSQTLCDLWTTGYLNIQIEPLSNVANYGTITNVKFQIGLEYI